MAKYKITGPDGSSYEVTAPDDASEADVLAYAQQNFAAPTAAPKDEGSHIGNLAAGLVRGAGSIGATLLAPVDIISDALDGKGLSLESNRERRAGIDGGLQELGAQPDSLLYKAGKLTGEIGGTAGVGGVAANGIRALSSAPGAAALANAVASGGMRTDAALGTAANLATRTAGGAINGGLSAAVIDPEAAKSGAVAGAVFPNAMKFLGGVGSSAVGTAKGLVEPLFQRGREAIAGRVLNQAAGETAPAVAARLATATELVPGSLPTAGQVAENGGIAALERTLSTKPPHTSDFAARGMEQAAARTQALRNIAQDEPARAAAVAARKAAADPLYEQATRATYTVTPALEKLLQTPAMKQALVRAEALAANNQRPFTFNVADTDHFAGLANQRSTASKQITGQGLQDLKMAVDDMLKDPTTGFQGSAGDAVRGLRAKLVNYMESSNPIFREARTTYADLSKPVNAMDVGGALLDKMKPALADYGNVSRETGNAYAAALRDSDKVVKKATDFKGARMEEIMSPAQMETLGAIAKDLARKANMQDLGRGVGSDTFQKLAVGNIAQQSGFPRIAGALLSVPGVNKLSGIAYSQPEQQIQSLIAKALLEPQTAANLMTKGSVSAAGPTSAIGKALGGRQVPQITAGQSQELADLFARVAPIAYAR